MHRNRSDFDSAMRRFESSRPGHITQGPFSIELPRNRPHAWDDRSTLTVWLTAYPLTVCRTSSYQGSGFAMCRPIF
jgi:hypothetical protein